MKTALFNEMEHQMPGIDSVTEFLLSNGDSSCCAAQWLYECAWERGIRQIDESYLKPSPPKRKRKQFCDMQQGDGIGESIFDELGWVTSKMINLRKHETIRDFAIETVRKEDVSCMKEQQMSPKAINAFLKEDQDMDSQEHGMFPQTTSMMDYLPSEDSNLLN